MVQAFSRVTFVSFSWVPAGRRSGSRGVLHPQVGMGLPKVSDGDLLDPGPAWSFPGPPNSWGMDGVGEEVALTLGEHALLWPGLGN